MENESRTGLVVLDFDGTLVDTRDDIVDGVNQALEDLGLPRRPGPEIAGYIGRGVEHLLGRSLPEDCLHLLPRILERFRHRYDACFDRTAKPYPGVTHSLERLRTHGLLLAVASNKPSRYLVKLLEKFELQPFFQSVLGGDDMERKKPDPWCIEWICQQNRMPANRTLMVGDMRYDVETGVNAGTGTCGVLYGYGTAEDLHAAGARQLLETFPDLVPLVT